MIPVLRLGVFFLAGWLALSVWPRDAFGQSAANRSFVGLTAGISVVPSAPNELGFNGSGPCTLAGYGRAPVFTAAANVGRRVSPAILGRVEGTIQYFREGPFLPLIGPACITDPGNDIYSPFALLGFSTAIEFYPRPSQDGLFAELVGGIRVPVGDERSSPHPAVGIGGGYTWPPARGMLWVIETHFERVFWSVARWQVPFTIGVRFNVP